MIRKSTQSRSIQSGRCVVDVWLRLASHSSRQHDLWEFFLDRFVICQYSETDGQTSFRFMGRISIATKDNFTFDFRKNFVRLNRIRFDQRQWRNKKYPTIRIASGSAGCKPMERNKRKKKNQQRKTHWTFWIDWTVLIVRPLPASIRFFFCFGFNNIPVQCQVRVYRRFGGGSESKQKKEFGRCRCNWIIQSFVWIFFLLSCLSSCSRSLAGVPIVASHHSGVSFSKIVFLALLLLPLLQFSSRSSLLFTVFALHSFVHFNMIRDQTITQHWRGEVWGIRHTVNGNAQLRHRINESKSALLQMVEQLIIINKPKTMGKRGKSDSTEEGTS